MNSLEIERSLIAFYLPWTLDYTWIIHVFWGALELVINYSHTSFKLRHLIIPLPKFRIDIYNDPGNCWWNKVWSFLCKYLMINNSLPWRCLAYHFFLNLTKNHVMIIRWRVEVQCRFMDTILKHHNSLCKCTTWGYIHRVCLKE